MQRQLTWWSPDGPAATTQPIWEDLDRPEQTRVIAALARLISKAAEPQSSDGRKEDDHEQ
jgi:hypothetical protein